ncbi:molybdate ABC transporter substrate-binding protein [Thiomicrospira sp. R3]|uniref:molybdate ABC transporter substrate-binding protein n=1 Tax=Thiomicrospira sp. R3 TaxID=3035472 RepID=UPI00259B1D55|nr:molybdate ABC transporter substrate-binding protein [Thiomicrospira sp. R3]WFE69185.1 molybdate ABC transporter substrate-binding protein [Thiomicrospira sp. R3]
MKRFLIALVISTFSVTAQAQKMIIAAASDLKFALDEIHAQYLKTYPNDQVEVIYGSSGRFSQQIENGAPFDLFFSASMDYPKDLQQKGFAATEPKLYALGRIVIWSRRHDASQMTLNDLMERRYRRVAIASPDHAPYGVRAMEALQAAGIWDEIQPKIVIGENIAHAAQLIESGAANIGIIALALALNPQLSRHGGYSLIPEEMHQPLEQAYIITQRAKDNPIAFRFAEFMEQPVATRIMEQYGFVVK